MFHNGRWLKLNNNLPPGLGLKRTDLVGIPLATMKHSEHAGILNRIWIWGMAYLKGPLSPPNFYPYFIFRYNPMPSNEVHTAGCKLKLVWMYMGTFNTFCFDPAAAISWPQHQGHTPVVQDTIPLHHSPRRRRKEQPQTLNFPPEYHEKVPSVSFH